MYITGGFDALADNLVSVNFTLTAPNGTNVIENVNATANNGTDWNSTSFTLDQYGQWNYTIIAWDENQDGGMR